MKIINNIKLISLTILFTCSSYGNWDFKPLDEFPPEKGGPMASFVLFIKAASIKDVEAMKAYAGVNKTFVIEKDPEGVEKLAKHYGTIDLERLLVYDEQPEDEDGEVMIGLKFHREGMESQQKMRVKMKKYENRWKLQ